MWAYYKSLAYDKVVIILSLLLSLCVYFSLSLLFTSPRTQRVYSNSFFFKISRCGPTEIFLLFMIFVPPCVRWFYLSLEFISNFIYEKSYLRKMSDPSKEHDLLDVFCFSVSLISFIKLLRRFCFICFRQILLLALVSYFFCPC